MLVDFEKAFDTPEWPFSIETLKVLNFGEKFINWANLLYTNILSCVSNNGFQSEYFSLSRGIRKIGPIAALLFILVTEIMAVNCKDHMTKLKG